jgi:hypothetical protein
MSLEQFAHISTIIQGFVVVVSLGFIVYQLIQNTRLAKASNVQSLTEHAAAFNSLLFQDPDLVELWYSYGKDIETADRKKLLRYREMLVQWLIFHQNIYYQWQSGLLEESIYNSWLYDLEFTINKHNVGVITNDLEKFFPGEFGHHLSALKKLDISKQFGAPEIDAGGD